MSKLGTEGAFVVLAKARRLEAEGVQAERFTASYDGEGADLAGRATAAPWRGPASPR